MSERQTPETDAFLRDLNDYSDIELRAMTEHARRLERERDEAREAFKLNKKHLCDSHRDMLGNCIVCQMEGVK
jgi:hypothetical protein